jgi:hypothetical protein
MAVVVDIWGRPRLLLPHVATASFQVLPLDQHLGQHLFLEEEEEDCLCAQEVTCARRQRAIDPEPSVRSPRSVAKQARTLVPAFLLLALLFTISHRVIRWTVRENEFLLFNFFLILIYLFKFIYFDF